MMTLNHRQIGKTVFSAISKSHVVKLDEKSLTYGCIKPDLVPRLRAIPHYKEKSSDFVNEIFEEMRNQELPKCDKEIKMFSINLGVIMHYIADFFCYAHNCRAYAPILPHFIYENNLALIFAFSDLDKICMDAIYSIKEQHIQSKEWLREYLDGKHDEYMCSRRNMTTDVRFSIEACITVALVIVASCMGRNEEVAA
ncbi:MAG: hypothetical protein APF77_19270 [Clostridia bacterium BRH_c25]|nr:MAG: hypothetical protein APF77_19270 [Clostridia bacterium BRH_c25]